MHSFATEPLSAVIHNRNGDNMANIVAKLVEKTDSEMVGKYGSVQPPLPFNLDLVITLLLGTAWSGKERKRGTEKRGLNYKKGGNSRVSVDGQVSSSILVVDPQHLPETMQWALITYAYISSDKKCKP